jgi:hypothetical protein
MRAYREFGTVTPWWYILAGCCLGVALGILSAPLLGYETPKAAGEGEEPGLGSKVLAKIPTKVKMAGAVGAVKGAGGEAVREVRRSWRS